MISRVFEGAVSWETAELFTVPKPTKEKVHWICKLGHCISTTELMQRTNNVLQTGLKLLSIARMGNQGKFEHTASAIKKKFEVGQAWLNLSSEESTTALNKFEAGDLKKKVQVLFRACDTVVMWETASNFPEVSAVLASVVSLAGNFYCYNEVVETISQVILVERGSNDVTEKQRRVESCDHLSVFGTLVESVLSWLEFLLVLMLGIKRKFWKLEKTNDSQILAVKPNNQNQQDQVLGCSLVETYELRQETGLMKLKQVFKNYNSRSGKSPLVPESAMDTSNFPPCSGSMQRCDCGLKQSSSLGGSNQRLRLRLRLEVSHRIVLAIQKTPLLKMSSGRERRLKFSKRRSAKFGVVEGIQKGTWVSWM